MIQQRQIRMNSSLIELCQAQFQLALPNFETTADDINPFFDSIDSAINGMRNWRLSREVNVGLYSFTKLQMYRDLDPKNWPDATKLTAHPLVNALAGTSNQSESDLEDLPKAGDLDSILSPLECYQVVDADSSQQAAILAAKRGMNMVIDGPPGTGKSQTITNIIGECLAAGKTILFVSEKSAALEVVKRRLEQVGLGDFVLELHSRQGSKKVVIDEINRVLEKQTTSRNVSASNAEELERKRQFLNNHARDLHEPFGRLSLSPFQAISRAVGLGQHPETTADIPDVVNWTFRQLTDGSEQIDALDRLLSRVGNPGKHPWRGASLTTVGLRERQQIIQCCQKLSKAIARQLKAAGSLAALLGKPMPRNLKQALAHLEIGASIIAVPTSVVGALRNDEWSNLDDSFSVWMKTGEECQTLQEQWQDSLKPDTDGVDWELINSRRIRQSKSVFRFLMPSWRSDGKLIRSATKAGVLPSIQTQLDLLGVLVQRKKLRKNIEDRGTPYAVLLGTAFAGADSDWRSLARFKSDVLIARAMVSNGSVSVDRLEKLLLEPGRTQLRASITEAQSSTAELQAAWNKWLSSIGSTEKQWLKSEFAGYDLAEIFKRLSELPPQIDALQDYVDVKSTYQRLSNTPMRSFVAWALGPDGKVCHGQMSNTFKRHFYRLFVDAVFANRPALRSFRGEDHESLIKRFAELDRDWLRCTRDRLASLVAARRPSAGHTAHRQSKLGIIQAEARKKIRHMPLRKLLREVGDVVQSIKPCFMMSPLSVAQFLEPGGIQFDLVIFDEASQVEPADAYGAIARAKQVILVGDENQLPPTSFFGRADADAAESGHIEFKSSDLESILSLGIVRFPHRCGLRWHYRSRHASLIDFSNYKFYQGQLRVFPSPHTDCSEYGLAFRYVEGAVYLRGAGRYNPVEAGAVATEVMRHALDHPELSLGVGTLNQPQQRAIEDEIERLRRGSTDPRIEQFFSRHQNGERFFVKNLENIQGDEREVIFLSVGFGRDADGKFSVAFGALNSEGGWRRLNVLVTRARRRCLVFSSIRHDDINLGSTQVRGVVALKEYLYAAEHGRLRETAVPGGDHDSEFEADVCRSLQAAGWEVHSQIGCAGFSIDLAVVDPRSPGRYLLGVECDGATYHSSPTARDRDRLRQEVLENLGWTIHRIWSTDWFHRPKPVLQQLLERLESLKNNPLLASRIPELPIVEQTEAEIPADAAQSASTTEIEPEYPPKGTVLYMHLRNAPSIGTSETLMQFPIAESARIVQQIVRTEGPIHTDEALRVYADLFGVRASAKPRAQFMRAVAHAESSKWLNRREDFLWASDHGKVLIRHRARDCPVTDSEMIPPEEFEAAVMYVVREQFGIKFDALIEAVARLFGFSRTGAKLKRAVEGALIRLDGRRELQQDASGFVTLPENPNVT